MRPRKRLVLPCTRIVLTALTLTSNSPSTAALTSRLVASSETRNTTWLCSEAAVAFSVITGARMMSYISCRVSLVSAGGMMRKRLISALSFQAGLELLRGVAGQHQQVAAQDVVHVGALLRQDVHLGQIAGGAGKALIDRGAVDDQHRLPAERIEAGPQRFGLGLAERRRVDDDELAFGLLCRQRGLEPQPAHFLLQTEAVVAHHRAEDHRAATELRRAQTALAGAAGALLLVGLLGGAADLADALGLVRAGATLGELPVDDAGEDVAPHRQPEYLVGQLDVADFLVVEIADGQLHAAPSPVGSVSAGVASGAGSASPPSLPAPPPSSAPRRAAGNGRPSGALRLTASLISTQPPSLPGTEPLIINRPRSASEITTCRLCVVTRSAPRWPAIFLFLKVLPGSWRCPVEPWLRCETETPWVARNPLKLCRFIAPAKPLPMLVPVTSTYCPGRKCAAVISAPTSTSASSETRNSARRAFGSTLALAKWPRCGFVTFLTLAVPTPSWSAV